MIHPLAVIGEPAEVRALRSPSYFRAPAASDWSAYFGPFGVPRQEFHPSIPESCLIEAYVTVDAGAERTTTLGERVWLMKKVHIGHDCIIGNDVEIAPLSSVGGFAEIGDGVHMGQGVTIRPGIKVGAGAVIGAGAVVTKDVPPGELWAGVPARKMEKGRIASVVNSTGQGDGVDVRPEAGVVPLCGCRCPGSIRRSV